MIDKTDIYKNATNAKIYGNVLTRRGHAQSSSGSWGVS